MLGRTDLVNKLVSKNLGISEEVVESVMTYFWKGFEKEIVECNHPYLFIRGLGTFNLNLSAIENRLRSLIFHLRKNKNSTAWNPKREHYMTGIQREIFFLFRIRRSIKGIRKTNKELKYGKITNDIEGQPIPINR